MEARNFCLFIYYDFFHLEMSNALISHSERYFTHFECLLEQVENGDTIVICTFIFSAFHYLTVAFHRAYLRLVASIVNDLGVDFSKV